MKQQRIILTVACMAIFFEALDVSVLNMAIPQMELFFHFGADAIQWVQTVYVLFYAGLVLLGGRLADTQGRKKNLSRALLLLWQRRWQPDALLASAGYWYAGHYREWM